MEGVYILCDSDYILLWKYKNYGDSKEDKYLLRVSGEGRKSRKDRIFRVLKIFCVIL
jgi:hypothetical protein